jgi:predicted LPLAT superfamily acyltransferase
LGAHLGSFEAMRASSQKEQLRLVAVGYFKNAAKINAALDKYGANSTKLVHVEPGTVGYLIKIKQLLDEGHLVAMLGDREIGGPTVVVDFLGGKIRLPVGPYALASQLGCPILVTFGLYTGPNKYDPYCEPLGSVPKVSRKGRDEVYKDAAQRYARIVEKYCHKAPLNWFNFYDYWI